MARAVTSALMGDPPKGRTPWADPSGPTDGLSPTARILAPSDKEWAGRADEMPKGGDMAETDKGANLATPAPSTAQHNRVTYQSVRGGGLEGFAQESTTLGPAGNAGDLSEYLAAGLRAVAPLFVDGAHGGLGELQPIPTEAPMVEWLAPTDLLVSEAYQRSLGPKSVDLIRRIAEGWDWRRFKPPIVAWTDAGFEVIDGQHTAIGAASRPDVPKIPVVVVVASEMTDRASAFVGHNKDRLNVSPMQLHHARVAAGDDEAVTVEQVCARAGVNLVRSAYGGYAWKAGDTVAVDAIRKLVDARGAMKARQVLETLVQAGCAPVSAAQIKGADFLLTTDQYADQLEPYPQNVADLAQAIKTMGDGAEKEARLFAKANCVPQWKALAVTWFSKTKKRRKAA